jgi:membrane associated rhomboid family serine protease
VPAKVSESSGPAGTPYTRARNALIIVLGILAVLWIIQIVNSALGYRLDVEYGIQPRILDDLPFILTAPFLHLNWAHIEGNSGPLLILGFLAAYRGVPKFIGVTAIVLLTSGLLAWLADKSGSYTVGASGVIFGWFGYVMVRGFFSHHKVDMIVGVLAALYYISVFTLLLPAPGLGYQDHIGGLVGGVLCGWIFRTRHTAEAVSPGRGPGGPADVAAATPVTRSPDSQIEAELAALKRQFARNRQRPDDRPGT